MRYKTLQDVPDGKLRKWLAVVERTFGTNSPTAKAYRHEIQRRLNAGKGVKRHGK